MKILIYLKNNFFKLAYYFFLFSFFGYLFEVSKHFIMYHEFVNRGTYYGPILPIYGLCAMIGISLLEKFKNKPILLFILCGITCNIIEFTLSYIAERVFNMRWWDYTKYPLNIDGRICLYSFLLFGLFGFIIIKFLLPLIDKLYDKLCKKNFKMILILLLVIFGLDVIYTFSNPHTGKSISYPVVNKNKTS